MNAKPPHSDDFVYRLRQLAALYPARPVAVAMRQIEGGWEPPSHLLAPESTASQRAEWVFNNPEIMQLLVDGLKINAIKATRAATGLGLTEAKVACETAWEFHVAGMIPEAEARRIDQETQIALASIHRTLQERKSRVT